MAIDSLINRIGPDMFENSGVYEWNMQLSMLTIEQ
jgi:hypothetical protein